MRARVVGDSGGRTQAFKAAPESGVGQTPAGGRNLIFRKWFSIADQLPESKIRFGDRPVNSTDAVRSSSPVVPPLAPPLETPRGWNCDVTPPRRRVDVADAAARLEFPISRRELALLNSATPRVFALRGRGPSAPNANYLFTPRFVTRFDFGPFAPPARVHVFAAHRPRTPILSPPTAEPVPSPAIAA